MYFILNPRVWPEFMRHLRRSHPASPPMLMIAGCGGSAPACARGYAIRAGRQMRSGGRGGSLEEQTHGRSGIAHA